MPPNTAEKSFILCSVFGVLLNKICLNRRKSFLFLWKKKTIPSQFFLDKLSTHFFLKSDLISQFFLFFSAFFFLQSADFSQLFFVLFTLHSTNFSQSMGAEGMDPNFLFPNKSENLIPLTSPGLYRITCLETNKVYIGESENILSRLRFHMNYLKANQHDCFPMQIDFNTFGENKFTFHILFLGPEWQDLEKRRKKETEIISFYSPDSVYNTHPDSPKVVSKNYRVSCEIYGIKYHSINEASAALQISETVIRQKLRNNHPGFKILEKVTHGYTPVIIEGIEYDSLGTVVEAGLAKNRLQVGRRLNSTHRKWQNWNYKYGKKQSKEK